MFIHNYLFLQRFVKELNPIIKSKTLHSVWGLGMDELVLNINQEYYLKFSNCGGRLIYEFCCETYVPSSIHKPRFRHLWGDQIDNLFQKKFDRIWGLTTKQKNILYFTCFGSFSNILFFKKGEEKVAEIFRYSIKKDLEKTKQDFNTNIFESKDKNNLELNTLSFIPDSFIQYHKDKTDLNLKELSVMSEDFSNQMQFIIIENEKGLPELGPVFTKDELNISTALEAANLFYRKYVSKWHFSIEKESQTKSIEVQIKKKKVTLSKIKERIDFLKNSRPDSEIADIILSGLHLIKPGNQKVKLPDFYRGGELELTIPKDTKPAAYAEKLYRKQSGRKGEVERLEADTLKFENELKNLKESLEILKETNSGKGLRKLKNSKTSGKVEKLLPFHLLNISGYTIQIGRNAKANDEMLRKFSGKNDLWFHAKDVSGSHVIIRRNDNKTVPAFIIEKTASIAAYYSKLRNQSLVPVMYTERKHVRKAKGLPAGQVFVDKEKVILVKPEKE